MTIPTSFKGSFLAVCLMMFSLVLAGEGQGPTSFSEMAGGSLSPKTLTIQTNKNIQQVAQPGLASLTYYSDRATFDLNAPDIALEDFEGGTAGPGGVVSCGSPLDSNPSPCFPDGIEEGLEVHDSSGTNVVALGPGIVPINPTTWVAANRFADVISLEFTNGDAFAVGLDIYEYFGAPTITINVYSDNGLIGTNIALSGGFWGVISDEPITKLVLGVDRDVITIDNVAFGNPIVDTDGDGIPDDEDSCPESDLRGYVNIDGCYSGVVNYLLDGGCTINDLLADCAAGAANHGQFVSCVAHLTNMLNKDGIISGSEKGAIQRCAARSNLP